MRGQRERSVGPRPTTAGILPLRLAYGNRLGAGETFVERVANLERRATGTITGLVMADSTFILPDSVEYDTLANVWRTITMDTIRTRELAIESGGLPERWWVDDGGRLVRLETLFGVTLQQSPFDYSQTLYRDTLRDSGPVPRRALAGVRSLVGAGLRPDTSASTMRYRIARVDRPLRDDALRHLAGGAQSADSGVLTIQRGWPTGAGSPPEGYLVLPEGRADPAPSTRFLADTAFAGARTARDSIIRLTRWVARRIAVDTNLTHDSDPDQALRTGTAPPMWRPPCW
jgi:hypothetical protein